MYHRTYIKCFIAAEFDEQNGKESVVKSLYGKVVDLMELKCSNGSSDRTVKLGCVDWFHGLHYDKRYNVIYTTINQKAGWVRATTLKNY